jgi:hypothetical protein
MRGWRSASVTTFAATNCGDFFHSTLEKQRGVSPITPIRFVQTTWFRQVCSWDLEGSGSTHSVTPTVPGWTKPEHPWECSRS